MQLLHLPAIASIIHQDYLKSIEYVLFSTILAICQLRNEFAPLVLGLTTCRGGANSLRN